MNRLDKLIGIPIYHGNNHTSKGIELDYIDGSVNEHGVGIYFTEDYQIASTFGKYVMGTVIDVRHKHLTLTTNAWDDDYSVEDMGAFINELNKNDREFWYIFSDYIGIAEPSEVTEYSGIDLAIMMKGQETRHIQQELIDAMGGAKKERVFAKAWLKHLKSYGLYASQHKFYILLKHDKKFYPDIKEPL